MSLRAHGTVTVSADRTCTAQFGAVFPAFTDDPLVPESTVVKTAHVMELRLRIDDIRKRLDLPAFAWTDPAPALARRTARATHIAKMRAALDEAFDASKQSKPAYTDPALAAGDPIKAVHVAELRSAVLTLE